VRLRPAGNVDVLFTLGQFAFSALTLLVGRLGEHPAWKKDLSDELMQLPSDHLSLH